MRLLRSWPALSLTVLLMLGACSAADSGGSGADSAPSTGESAESISWLFVLDAGMATVEGETLVLRGLNRATTWFADRPARAVERRPIDDLVAAWEAFGFVDDPPNAVVQWSDAAEEDRVTVVELGTPTLAEGTLRFPFQLVPIDDAAEPGATGDAMRPVRAGRSADALPPVLGPVTLFIDDGQTASAPVEVEVVLVNHSGRSPDDVYVAVTGAGTVSTKPNATNTGVALSDLDAGDDDGEYRLTLTEPFISGRFWISLDEAMCANGDCKLPTVQPDPNVDLTRFAIAELTMPGHGVPGSGDVEYVDFFSFPLDVAAFDASGTQTAESTTSAPTDCVIEALDLGLDRVGIEVADVTISDSNGDFVRILAPSKNVAKVTPWPSMTGYLVSVADLTLEVSGGFSNPQFSEESGSYAYEGTHDGTSATWTFSGTIADGNPGHDVVIADADLAVGIYTQAATYRVPGDEVPTRFDPADPPPPATPDDVYESIYRDVVAGFAYGFWGGRYGGGTDNSAFESKPAFAAARAGSDSYATYSVYSAVLAGFTNSYTMPFSDAYGSGGQGSPLLSVPSGGRFQITIGADPKPADGCPTPSP